MGSVHSNDQAGSFRPLVTPQLRGGVGPASRETKQTQQLLARLENILFSS